MGYASRRDYSDIAPWNHTSGSSLSDPFMWKCSLSYPKRTWSTKYEFDETTCAPKVFISQCVKPATTSNTYTTSLDRKFLALTYIILLKYFIGSCARNILIIYGWIRLAGRLCITPIQIRLFKGTGLTNFRYSCTWYENIIFFDTFNPLTPNDPYRGRTASLTSKVAFHIFIQQI